MQSNIASDELDKGKQLDNTVCGMLSLERKSINQSINQSTYLFTAICWQSFYILKIDI